MILKTVLKQEVCPCVPAGPPTGTSYVMRGKCAVAVLAQKHMRARGGHCRAPQVRNKGTRGHPGAGGCGARGRGPRGEARGAAGARIKKRTCAAPRSAPYSTIRAFPASQAPSWLLAWPS